MFDAREMYDKYFTMAQDDPAKAYKGLAKVIDQRLVSLEHAKEKEGTKSATQYAYKYAMRELRSLYGEGVYRFNRTIKPEELIDSAGRQIDINTIYQARINAMLSVLQLPTSTIGGLRDTYQKIADSLNEKYTDLGFEFDVNNIGDFFESEAYDELGYESDTVLDAIGTFKKNEEEIAEKIKEYSENNSHIKEDGTVDFSEFRLNIGANKVDEKVITEMVKKLGVRSLDDMYKGFGVGK